MITYMDMACCLFGDYCCFMSLTRAQCSAFILPSTGFNVPQLPTELVERVATLKHAQIKQYAALNVKVTNNMSLSLPV